MVGAGRFDLQPPLSDYSNHSTGGDAASVEPRRPGCFSSWWKPARASAPDAMDAMLEELEHEDHFSSFSTAASSSSKVTNSSFGWSVSQVSRFYLSTGRA
jgi:hypothetical protein